MKAWKQLTSCFHPCEQVDHHDGSSKQQQGQQGPSSGTQTAAGEGREPGSVSEEEKEGKDTPPSASATEILAGTPGPELSVPCGRELQLDSIDARVLASQSGPDGGIDVIRSCAPGLQLPWDREADWAYGSSISLYDATITAGKPTRSGDPIADCFSVIAYKSGALLAAADGVNWGEPARRAARCAVLGSTQQLHSMLKERHGKEPGLTCMKVFPEMLDAVKAAQALILQQFGTLTTLVLTLVMKLHPSEVKGESRWAAFTLTIGDSQAYVWRAKRGKVQELTYASHAGSVRNTAITDGALGHSLGDDPDLSNMTASTTLLDEGDIVFLATDGVTDNFDPTIRKQAKPAINLEALSLEAGTGRKSRAGEPPSADSNTDQGPGAMPTLSPQELHDKSLELLTQAIRDITAKPLQEVVAGEKPSRFVVSLDGLVEGDPQAPPSPGPQSMDLHSRHSTVFADETPSLLFSRMASSQRTSPDDSSLLHGAVSPTPASPTAATAAATAAAAKNTRGHHVNSSAPLPFLNSRGLRPNGNTNGIHLGRTSANIGAKIGHRPKSSTQADAMKVEHGWDSEPLEKQQQQQKQEGEQQDKQEQKPPEPGSLTARALADGLLQHVYKVTEPLRLHAAASNAGKASQASSLFAGKSAAPPVSKPDLPGKLDHATLVAYQVGDQ